MEKYGTPQELIEEDGLFKVGAEKLKQCCLEKLASITTPHYIQDIALVCNCGNRIVAAHP